MYKYHLEFTLETDKSCLTALKSSIAGFGDDLQVHEIIPEEGNKNKDFKIHISTLEPTIIFDLCAEFGRIKSVKINEERG